MTAENSARVEDRDFANRAHRLFRRLREPGAFLRWIAAGKQPAWGLYVGDNGFRRPVMRLKPSFIEALCKREWLVAQVDGTLSADPKGLAWHNQAAPRGAHRDIAPAHTGMREFEDDNGERITARINTAESTLGWLRTRRDATGAPLLSAVQFEAGERFRVDFERARMMPRVTASWEATVRSRRSRRSGRPADPVDRSPAALAAKTRVFRALDAVGPDLEGMLIELCCNLNGLEHAERVLKLPQRSGKVVLQIALNQLARHYGLIMSPRPLSSGRIGHWGTSDYRPSIDGE